MILSKLRSHCLDLRIDVRQLLALLKDSRTPTELRAYKRRIIKICTFLEEKLDKILSNIDLDHNELAEDILSDIQQVTGYMRVVNARFAAPILRASDADRLSLSVVNWLHSNHQETKAFPPAVGDGNVSVWPTFPHVYQFPQLERRGLLYQPLLFHEFGHVLYFRHKKEMDDLVAELQKDIADLIFPLFQRNDRHSEIQAQRRQLVVDTWYSWTQELFCDAVGLRLGGPSFLYAFSSYLGTVSGNDFYRKVRDLELSDHPVTWLRVHFLAKKARITGFDRLAGSIEDEWNVLAQTMQVREDYHGFYDKVLEKAVWDTIENMLIEAEPRPCTKSEVELDDWKIGDSPIKLVNLAWHHKKQDTTASYAKWEEKYIKKYLNQIVENEWPDDLEFQGNLTMVS